MGYILIVTPRTEESKAIRKILHSEYKVEEVSDKVSFLEKFQKKRYEFTLLDLEVLRGEAIHEQPFDYRKAFQPFWHAYPSAKIIVLSTQEMIREAVKAVKAGASNYLTFPVDRTELKYVIESLYEDLKIESELDYFRDKFWREESLEVVRTNSPIMKKVFDKVRSVAPTRTTVLLTGETGTGKGEIAKLIHRHSSRSDQQFISVHCGAIPDTLLESELFGHERGAFTGAVRRKLGKFEIAEGGTIFLDEIGTITPSAQIKLLQVLQDRTFQRVGGEEILETNVRIIGASNADLQRMSDAGLFRKDLFYRLNVFPIDIPPLRERSKDIPWLVEVFLNRFRRFHAKEVRGVHPQVMEALERYPWPGNIRELENLIERASILENSPVLTAESFPSELLTFDEAKTRLTVDTSLTLAEVRKSGVEKIELRYLKEVLASTKGKINESAKAAGITPRQVHKLMTKYGLRKEEFR